MIGALRGPALALAVLLIGAVAIGGCDPGGPTSEATGVVLRVESTGLANVTGFTIRTDAGEMLQFSVGPLQPGSFPPGHLTEHAATGQPVLVTYTTAADGTLVAVKLVDAPGTTAPPSTTGASPTAS